jgi:plastocyanin
LAGLLLCAPVAQASVAGSPGTVSATTSANGVQHLHYAFGPLHIKPGQNTIEIANNRLRPTVPGYIVRFAPNLRRGDGTIPRVDVLHLHHGVWVINGYPTFAAGEEKTVSQLPRGYGFPYQPSDHWLMNYMIHNLTPTADTVFITYDLDFIAAGSSAARGIAAVHPQWMDVTGLRAYPVFDVLQGSGRNGKFTYPDQAAPDQLYGVHTNQVPVTQNGVLVQTAGHLHPGGLYDDLWLSRGGRRVHLFRSVAHYYEPAGAVSWDVSMTATRPHWRVAVRRGDVLSITGTYDSRRASWYESMGIMVVAVAAGARGGVDPFRHRVDLPGRLTHGHLAENNNHGGGPVVLPDAVKMLDGPADQPVIDISQFQYGQGDLTLSSPAGRPPVIHAGASLTFHNSDASQTIFHTITSCRAPCNRATGIAYPLADGAARFDSAELGFGPRGFTAASNRDTWSTPRGLGPGTYNYFCRIHPFMRGAFRIVR